MDGNALNTGRSVGLIAANGVTGPAASTEISKEFVEKLWALSPPAGVWRYYDGLLYFMSTLHAAGEFKIWKP